MIKRILSCAVCAVLALSALAMPGLAEAAAKVSYLGPAGTYIIRFACDLLVLFRRQLSEY